MKTNYYRFLVKFSLVGELEIEARNSVDAEEIVKEMSDREIEHRSEYGFETMQVTEDPELIS